MGRTSRTATRIFFLLVLAAGLMGGWVAASAWRIDAASLSDLPGLSEQTDWVDTLSLVGEQAIQFFLGVANAQ